MKKLKLSLLALCLTSVFATPVHAKPPCKDAHEKTLGCIVEELNLTPEQQEKLKEIRKKHRETVKPLMAEKREAVKKLREGFKSGASADSLRASHKAIAAIHDKISTARFENALSVREILSPEQRAKFDDFKGKVREKFKDRIRKLVDEEDEVED